MAARITVSYTGGESETIKIGPLGMVAAERQFGSGVTNGHSMEAMLWGAWVQKGKPDGSLDGWLATMDDIVHIEGQAAAPLAEEPSAEESQT